MSLFEEPAENKPFAPLAAKLRPQRLEEFVGQEHVVGLDSPFRGAIESGNLGSAILWGPAGCGKTTLAHLIAKYSDAYIENKSAVTCGVSEIREISREAQTRKRRTILFLDEIHHFSRTQQDALLGVVEDGTIQLIGATTENPLFSLAQPLVSRCRIIILKPLTADDIKKIAERASDFLQVELIKEGMDALCRWANGDARVAINALELAAQIASPEKKINSEHIETAMNRPVTRYDAKGDQHYDVISAFIKSVRGSDPDAALHYLARMLIAGEDPRFIARRLVILASEDIGNANPMGLVIATSAFHAVERIGMPEARIVLAQATIFLAASPKSNSAYMGIQKAMEDLESKPAPSVPDYLRDPRSAHHERRQGMTIDKDYLYPHSFGGWVKQDYLSPEHGLSLPYYVPIESGHEKKLKEFLDSLNKKEMQ